MAYKLLIINPGSTSTKIGVYEDENPILIETLRHSTEEISKYGTIYEQFEFRKDVILKVLKDKNIDVKTLDAVVGRGGMLKPVEGGTYCVNEAMIEDLKVGVQGQHASNLGGIIASEIAKPLNIPSFIVDPVVVDEMEKIAKLSGHPLFERKSKFHALNQKAVGKRYANEIGKRYDQLSLIVAHMGGGVSVGAHKNGRVVDVNNALDGEGPYSPERSGGLPTADLVRLCFSGKYSMDEIMKIVVGKGGFVAHLGTNDAREVENKAKAGDQKFKLIHDGMSYQVAKFIGQAAAVLEGKVDAIILTGGLAYDKPVVEYIKGKVSFIAPVIVYPGEDELLALTQGALRVLKGEELPKEYK